MRNDCSQISDYSEVLTRSKTPALTLSSIFKQQWAICIKECRESEDIPDKAILRESSAVAGTELGDSQPIINGKRAHKSEYTTFGAKS